MSCGFRHRAQGALLPGSDKPKTKPAGCLSIIAFFLIAIALFGIVGTLFEGPKTTLVDNSFAPVIAGLDKYKSTNGRYPDNLDALLPAYLGDLPGCPDSTKPGAAYYVDPNSGDYVLGCYTGLFTKRLYDSRTRRWESGD